MQLILPWLWKGLWLIWDVPLYQRLTVCFQLNRAAVHKRWSCGFLQLSPSTSLPWFVLKPEAGLLVIHSELLVYNANVIISMCGIHVTLQHSWPNRRIKSSNKCSSHNREIIRVTVKARQSCMLWFFCQCISSMLEMTGGDRTCHLPVWPSGGQVSRFNRGVWSLT